MSRRKKIAVVWAGVLVFLALLAFLLVRSERGLFAPVAKYIYRDRTVIFQPSGFPGPEMARMIHLRRLNADEAARLLDKTLSDHKFGANRGLSIGQGDRVYEDRGNTSIFPSIIEIYDGRTSGIDGVVIFQLHEATWKDLLLARILAFGRDPVQRKNLTFDPKDFLGE